MNAQRWFQRKEDYAPCQSPAGSPFRQLDVTCLKCGSYDLRLAAQMDEEAGEMAVLLVCIKCRQREIMAVR